MYISDIAKRVFELDPSLEVQVHTLTCAGIVVTAVDNSLIDAQTGKLSLSTHGRHILYAET